jgi:hypothetical protein
MWRTHSCALHLLDMRSGLPGARPRRVLGTLPKIQAETKDLAPELPLILGIVPKIDLLPKLGLPGSALHKRRHDCVRHIRSGWP